MSKELITRGELVGTEMSAPWMLVSGQRQEAGPSNGFKAARPGIQLYVPDRELDLDVHDAGDLYAALEAHMENVAAPEEDAVAADVMTRPHGWDNLREVTPPLEDGVDAEFLGAMADVVEEWANPQRSSVAPNGRQDYLRATWPGLAGALDRLAALNA